MRQHPTTAPTRTSSLLITSLGLLTNTFLTFYLLSSSLSPDSALKWEPESEWESTSASASWLFGSLGSVWGGDSADGGAYGADDGWGWGAGGLGSKIDGVKLLWGLLIVYFGCAACVCVLGVWGVLKTLPPYIRFYRDYTIASLSFSTFVLALATYGAFRGHSRASLCESLSHYPELVRDLQEKGILSVELTLENCEGWLEGAVVVGLAGVCLIMAVRLHFLLAVSNYYSYITRYTSKSSLPTSSPSSGIKMSSSPSKTHSRSKSHSHPSSFSHPHSLSHPSHLHSQHSHAHSHSPSRTHTLPPPSSSSRSHAHTHTSGSSSSTSASSSSGTTRTRSNSTPSAPMQRIYLLPSSVNYPPPSGSHLGSAARSGLESEKGTSAAGSEKDGEKANEKGRVGGEVRMVYAPVPLDSLPLEMQVQAMEAWVQAAGPARGYGSGSDRDVRDRESRQRSSASSVGMGGNAGMGAGTMGGGMSGAMGAQAAGTHQRYKSHRRRSSSVLTAGGAWDKGDKGKHEA